MISDCENTDFFTIYKACKSLIPKSLQDKIIFWQQVSIDVRQMVRAQLFKNKTFNLESQNKTAEAVFHFTV